MVTIIEHKSHLDIRLRLLVPAFLYKSGKIFNVQLLNVSVAKDQLPVRPQLQKGDITQLLEGEF